MTGRDQLCSLEASGRTAVLRLFVYAFCCPHCVGQLTEKSLTNVVPLCVLRSPWVILDTASLGLFFGTLALSLSVMYNPTNGS